MAASRRGPRAAGRLRAARSSEPDAPAPRLLLRLALATGLLGELAAELPRGPGCAARIEVDGPSKRCLSLVGSPLQVQEAPSRLAATAAASGSPSSMIRRRVASSCTDYLRPECRSACRGSLPAPATPVRAIPFTRQAGDRRTRLARTRCTTLDYRAERRERALNTGFGCRPRSLGSRGPVVVLLRGRGRP